MSTTTTSETITTRLTLVLPEPTIRKAKAEAASVGKSISNWAAELFEAEAVKGQLRREISNG